MAAASEQAVIERLTSWAAADPRIRAVIWTSTRTNPEATVDALSDYDIILVVGDVIPYLDDAWLADFGSVLVLYRDPVRHEEGGPSFTRVTQYESGLKIDFTVMAAGRWQRWVAGPGLPPDLDVGYRVLLDEEDLTVDLPPATYRAHIPAPPDEGSYLATIESFFHEGTYVAKHLWRDELLPAKYMFECMVKAGPLRQMLEWHMEIDHDWSIKTGVAGKGLKKHLPPDLWAALEATYTGANIEANWEAFFATCDLFRRAATEVANALEYIYPDDLDRRVRAYYDDVRALPRTAALFERQTS